MLESQLPTGLACVTEFLAQSILLGFLHYKRVRIAHSPSLSPVFRSALKALSSLPSFASVKSDWAPVCRETQQKATKETKKGNWTRLFSLKRLPG